jgi:hypothetical protein
VCTAKGDLRGEARARGISGSAAMAAQLRRGARERGRGGSMRALARARAWQRRWRRRGLCGGRGGSSEVCGLGDGAAAQTRRDGE